MKTLTSLAISAKVATLALAICGLTFGLAAHAENGPMTCSIQTYGGGYLTAVGGGGRVNDVIHSDASQVQAWEKFTLVDSGEGTSNITYGIRTKTGHYLTFMNGGGRVTDVVHSNATQLLDWEKVQFISLGNHYYAIQTRTGHYLTAQDSGGRITDVLHTNATKIGSWEKFRVVCGI